MTLLCGTMVFGADPGKESEPLTYKSQKAVLAVTAVSDHCARITLAAKDDAPRDGAIKGSTVLVSREWPRPAVKMESLVDAAQAQVGKLQFTVSAKPFKLRFENSAGRLVQEIVMDRDTGALTFHLGNGPVLGLGEGAQQFDRRGAFYPMKNGQATWNMQEIGACIPIPLLISTSGWALFLHQPAGQFDLRGDQGRFTPTDSKQDGLMDLFVIDVDSPATALAEYIRLTGRPAMPPRWALGYLQSHRTLAGPEEVLAVADRFRRTKLPCDGLIYLGTGYCPAGWNKGHGTIEFNPKSFDKPAEIVSRLHDQHFHVMFHVNRAPKTLHGSIPAASSEEVDATHIAKYWDKHRPVFALGTDGWWPDDGDELPVEARLARHRMYYEGCLTDRPNERPYSLHRNGYAGIQRYGGWVWSGDVYSRWKTLENQISVGINFSLSASPFWGTDTGGFSPTKELTGELYARWFQFSTFCPSFRSHGRTWHTRLPWGWNTGELGPLELTSSRGVAAPDLEELRNPLIEPICRQYLNLRYSLLPYNYSAAREAHDTGMPLMRALWLHYPDDPRAVRDGKEYLWGRDLLVAPVFEKGAAAREVYLPKGDWYDWWTTEKHQGGRTIHRPVDLATLPFFVRAGAIVPMDPVRQYVAERVEEPTTLRIYRGADGRFVLYDDDGKTLDYLRGQGSWTAITWRDRENQLVIEPDARTMSNEKIDRSFDVLVLPEKTHKRVQYTGKRLEVEF
jgi:alpha-glucosidase/alpha-D-xyloside xylohydrolase